MEVSQILKEFTTKGYIQVSIDLSSQDLEDAKNSFLEAIKVDRKEKEKMYYCSDPLDSSTMRGFVIRDNTKTDTDSSGYTKILDSKEYFHYMCDCDELFKEQLKNCDKRITTFLNHVRKIHTKGYMIYEEIIKELDKKYEGIYENFFSNGKSNNRITTRFLAYYSDSKEQFLAKPHIDRAALTIAFEESAPGLRFEINGEFEDVHHEENKVFVFPGAYFEKYIDSNIKGLKHDVVQKSSDNINDKIARFALVMFALPQDPKLITFNDTRGFNK